MKAAIHYVVKAKLIRYINADDINFIDVEEKFENENPILARDSAFNFYQSYIDVLLQSKGIKYESDKQARKEIQSFIDTGTSTKINIGDKVIEFADSIGNGIGVFLVIDKPIEEVHESTQDNIGDDWLIHGIGSIGRFSNPQSLMDGLTTEYNYYLNFDYAINDKKITVNFLEEGEEEPYLEEILETPFDWTDYNILLTTETFSDSENKWLERIKGGEGKKVEFKSTLRYHIHLKKADKQLSMRLLKPLLHSTIPMVDF